MASSRDSHELLPCRCQASLTQVLPPLQNHRLCAASTNRSPAAPDAGCVAADEGVSWIDAAPPRKTPPRPEMLVPITPIVVLLLPRTPMPLGVPPYTP